MMRPNHSGEPMRIMVSVRLLALATLPLLAHCAALSSSAPGPPPGAILATLPVGSGPTLLAVSPDGSRVYAATNSKLGVIDTTANRVVATVPIDPYPTGLAVSPDGKRVYV